MSFNTRATVHKEVEMTEAEFAEYTDQMDRASSRERRRIEEQLFMRAGGSWEDAEFEDPELDEFQEATEEKK